MFYQSLELVEDYCMPSIPMKVDGNIIQELSIKIPSNIFALNELIKNSYDAFSTNIVIEVDPVTNKVVISDNGTGMGEQDIEKLLHISNSTKRYGSVITRAIRFGDEDKTVSRITQGAKGLGFLAAFKFGDKVTWSTCQKGVEREFTLNKNELIEKDDLLGTRVDYSESEKKCSGTTITIESSKKTIDSILRYFSEVDDDNKNIDLGLGRKQRLVGAFRTDEYFNIKLKLPSENYSTESLRDIHQEAQASQLFYIKYVSEDERIDFYHKGELVRQVHYCLSGEYSISIDLIAFYFGQSQKKKNISRMYFTENNSLTPLVFINTNLFNNNELFDPDIHRQKRSSEMMAQLIGQIEIVCNSEEIEFNSDRTNFVQNDLTDMLKREVKSLNELIQTEGSSIRAELKQGNRKLPLGRAKPENLTDGDQPVPVRLNVVSEYYEHFIYSDQLDLEELITEARDSDKNQIDYAEIEVVLDGTTLKSGKRIIPTQEKESTKEVVFKYTDRNTELASTRVYIIFKKKIVNIVGNNSQKLFSFEVEGDSGDYEIRIKNVSNLITAISSLYEKHNKKDYLPVIACSIRAIFEIANTELRHKWKSLFDKEAFDKDLGVQIIEIILLIDKNKALQTIISDETGMGFHNLKNLLSPHYFHEAIKSSNVGAHRSMSFLTHESIQHAAKYSGYFAVICNLLINSDSIDGAFIKKLNKVKKNEVVETMRSLRNQTN